MTPYKKTFIATTMIFGLNTLINIAWQALELFFHHQIMPSPEDSVMGMVLAVSLYYNLRIRIY